MIRDEFPEFYQFLGLCYHQDWDITCPDYPDTLAAAAAYATMNPATSVRRLRDEIVAFIARPFSGVQVREIMLHDLRCEYLPEADGMTYSEWLGRVAARISECLQYSDPKDCTGTELDGNGVSDDRQADE